MPTDHDLGRSTSAGRSGGSSAAAALTAAQYPLHFQPGTGARPQQAVRRDQQRLVVLVAVVFGRSEEHTSELQSLMRISYAVFCLKKKKYSTPPTLNYTRIRN